MNVTLFFAIAGACVFCVVMCVLSLTKYKKAFLFSMLAMFIALCVMAKEVVHTVVQDGNVREWLIVAGIGIVSAILGYWTAQFQDWLAKRR